MIKVTESLDIEKWSQFVHDHPYGTIFQTPQMCEVYKETKNYTPFHYFLMDDPDKIIALMQGVYIQDTGSFLSNFTARSVIQGGPLYQSVDYIPELFEKYDEFISTKGVYTQIRNLWDTTSMKNTLQQAGYVYDEHLNFLIDLNRTEDKIWQDIHKNRRKGISRAEKSGIIIRKIEEISEIDQCYGLLKSTYSRVKMPIADISLFKSAFKLLVPKGMADFYLALQDGEAVGTRIVLKYNGIVHDWYAGSKKDAIYVDEALVWQILKDNAGKYNIFEFGGAGHPDKEYGVREFKRRFGGTEVNFGRYQKVHSTIKKKMIEVGSKLYRGV
jgi:lipid II:glycine glycyltransferase (peptidoglycan interpeptide bridge formation enzyme)